MWLKYIVPHFLRRYPTMTYNEKKKHPSLCHNPETIAYPKCSLLLLSTPFIFHKQFLYIFTSIILLLCKLLKVCVEFQVSSKKKKHQNNLSTFIVNDKNRLFCSQIPRKTNMNFVPSTLLNKNANFNGLCFKKCTPVAIQPFNFQRLMFQNTWRLSGHLMYILFLSAHRGSCEKRAFATTT